MVSRLEEALAEVAKLPPDEQEALADWLLAELASERRWSKAFADSTGQLSLLANEALAEYHAQRAEPLDPEHL